jgi:outer membrane lipoprotein-sorting protein
MRKKSILKLLLITSFLFAPACTANKIIPHKAARISDNKEYLSKALNSSAINNHLSGKAKLKIISPEINFTSKAIFFFKNPSSIHLEILNFFNQPHIFFIANNNYIQMYIPSENKVFFDKPTKENISLLVGMPLDLNDLISIFACRTPEVALEKSKIILNQNAEHSIFEIINKNKTTKIWIDNEINKISKYKCYHNNAIQMEIEYLSYKQYLNNLLPSLIKLTIPSANYRLSLEFNTLNFNSFSDKLFKMNIPANTEVLAFPSSDVQ